MGQKWFIRLTALLSGMLCLTFQAGASELVWQPVNPSFGGNVYNASWLLSSAEAQNDLDGTGTSVTTSDDDTISDFESSLERQILSKITTQVIEAAFGEDEIQPGQYEVGNFSINVSDTMSGVGIVISDTVTGQETIIEVPYY